MGNNNNNLSSMAILASIFNSNKAMLVLGAATACLLTQSNLLKQSVFSFDLLSLAAILILISSTLSWWTQFLQPKVDVCVVTGMSVGLPGYDDHDQTFAQESLHALFKGRCAIEPLSPEVTQSMLDKNVKEVKKLATGSSVEVSVTESTAIKVAAPMANVDLSRYGVNDKIAAVVDEASKAAVAAGLEAMRDAGLVSGIYGKPTSWQLPEHLRATTGVIFASSFPAIASMIDEVNAFYDSKNNKNSSYSFDRKFLFRVLVLANAQLAEICKARGPNTMVNGACAGTTQALSLAQDWIRIGRCERVVVIGADTAANDTLMPWIGNGFRAMGVACLSADPVAAAQPFSSGRSGMTVGSAAVGMVLESKSSFKSRCTPAPSTAAPLAVAQTASDSDSDTDSTATTATTTSAPIPTTVSPTKRCSLIETYISNSAYHGTSLSDEHIAASLEQFLQTVEARHGITRAEIAEQGVFMSHETSTPLCAKSEVFALRKCLGNALSERILVANTKGLCGHPMGASIEDVVAVEILRTGTIPPVANCVEADPKLGKLNVSRGGECTKKFVLRFAAGFGSHVAFALYGLN
eukprot:c15057_g1_i1.p1 GENE.c15057_g1_i1~~c15057_g1_i1.p1  ORF type:complete len:579 (+),score=152.62 c15057_g1_i1:1-1737(+)